MKRTHRWALRCLEEFYKTRTYADYTRTNADKTQINSLNQVIFGIVQGGEYEDLRKESAKFINSLPFFGFGIGGSLGKSKKDIIKVLNWTLPFLNENKPKHLLGIGEVDDIFNSIEQGIDLFDCVIPTRWARHGAGFTFKGRINLKSSKYLNDKKPIDLECKCPICQKFSRAYISHLLKENEIYGIMLLTEHNVFWVLNLFKEIRKAIKENRFLDLKRKILKYW
jgi:tRNA-guanine transglycosylase